MENIKGIFFDIGWTLCKPATGDWMVPLKLFEYVSPAVWDGISKEKKDRAFQNGMNFLEKNHLVNSTDDELEQFKAYYAKIAEELPALCLTKEQTDRIAEDRVFNMQNFIFFEDIQNTLKTLSERYKLGIISDTWPSVPLFLNQFGILNYFSSVTLSCDLGVFKPDVRIYRHALDSMNLPAEQTVFVDDLPKNLDGAAKLGIHPVLVSQKEASANYKTIHHPKELIEIL